MLHRITKLKITKKPIKNAKTPKIDPRCSPWITSLARWPHKNEASIDKIPIATMLPDE